MDEKRSVLREAAPPNCLPSIILHSRIKRIEARRTQQNTHNKKLCALSEEQERPLFSVKNTVVMCDLTITPPKYVLETLSLGPKNAVLDAFEPKDILTELDGLINHCRDNDISEDTITDINIKTLNYIKKCKKMTTTRHIQKTKTFLKENSLLAVPFDKGIGICVMDISTYNSKMNTITGLPQFQKVVKTRKNEKHPVLKEEERIVSTLKALKDQGKISETLFNKLKPRGSQPPRLYGLAKVHKNNIPMRPVLSMPGSAYHKIGVQIAEWLSTVPQCRINSSSKSVCDSLKSVQLEEHEELVSFDVSALYTNVPVVEAIDICADMLFDQSDLPIDKDTFITLAKMASCNVLMSTHDGYYKQIDGLAMGSPPAPHLANGWMSQFDQTIQGDSRLYTRYMDDILCNIHADQIEDKLSTINSLHHALKFTIEREHNNTIPFLDLKIINNQG